MSKAFIEVTIEDSNGEPYDPFEITVTIDGNEREWDFSSDADKQKYNDIIADGVDKAEVDQKIEDEVSEAEPESPD